MMHFKQAAAATALASTLILIGGCSGAEYGITALDREATAADRLPDVVVDESVNADSVRKVAEQNQVAYFIGAMNDDQGYCAYAVDNDDVIGGCGRGHGQLVTVSPGGSSSLPQLTLVLDSYDTADLKRDNWVEVHTNIFVR
ncbi:hypothetical protein ACX80L_01280 [Arthrobacter sp. MDT1-48-3]